MKYIAHPVLAAEDSKEKDKYAYVVYAEDEKFDDPNVKLFWCEDGSAEVMSKNDADHFTYEEALKLEKMKGKHKWKMERVPHYGQNVSSSEMIRSEEVVDIDTMAYDDLYADVDHCIEDIITRYGGDIHIAGQSSRWGDAIDDIIYLVHMSQPYEEVIEDDVLEEI